MDPYVPLDPSIDYNKMPQRLHTYPASDRARKIVQDSLVIDSLFGVTWPVQYSNPLGPELHGVLEHVHKGGIKVLAAAISADSAGTDYFGALQFFLQKISEHPERYKIVRTTRDIDEAVAEGKLGIYFTHQGVRHWEYDPNRVGLFRQLGYGYCLFAYNTRNWAGDGCYERENSGLTGMGKLLVDAHNHYGMIVDVSHCGERMSLDICARSKAPVIASHSLSHAVYPYQRNISDELIKAIAATGGVCGTNMVGAYLDKSNPDIVTTDMVFRHIDHVVNLVGIDHVGFGSDWVMDMNMTATLMQAPIGQMFFNDGGVSMVMGKKGVPTPNPAQIVAALIDKLLEHGYTESDCKKFLGGNFYRVFKQVWR